MRYYLNACRCCLDDLPLDDILLKRKSNYIAWSDYYMDQIKYIYHDLPLTENLPFRLCYDCQRLQREANSIKQFLMYQESNEPSQKLLLNENVCSSCLETCTLLYVKIVGPEASRIYNKNYCDILQALFSQYHFQQHTIYKYCNSCCNYIKSAYLLKQLLIASNATYEKYCCTLTSVANASNLSLSKLTVRLTKLNTITVASKQHTKTEETLRHKNTASESRPSFKCRVCRNSFGNVGHRNRHEKLHSGDKPFQCKVCGASFVLSSYLKEHERVHDRTKPHKCDRCDRTFRKKTNLTIHRRLHTGDRPYSCPKCRLSFVRSGDLKSHEKNHTNDRPFKCTSCEESFKQKKHLKVHERIHAGEKPYKCDCCEKAFYRKDHLKSHRRVHTGSRRSKRKAS